MGNVIIDKDRSLCYRIDQGYGLWSLFDGHQLLITINVTRKMILMKGS